MRPEGRLTRRWGSSGPFGPSHNHRPGVLSAPPGCIICTEVCVCRPEGVLRAPPRGGVKVLRSASYSLVLLYCLLLHMLTIALPAAATFSGSGKSARARPGRPARSRGAGSSSSSALPPPPSSLPLLLNGFHTFVYPDSLRSSWTFPLSISLSGILRLVLPIAVQTIMILRVMTGGASWYAPRLGGSSRDGP